MRAAGSVALRCDAGSGRSRLRAIRCEGLSRSSRAFPAPDGAIRVMLSMLGPGVLGGDRFTLDGRVEERASLVAAGQMATPIFAGSAASESAAVWHVADGASLLVAGEPLLLDPGSEHVASATFAVTGSGVAIVVDTFGLLGNARFAMHTEATLDGTRVYRDAFDFTSDAAGAFGTVTLIAADADKRASFAAHAEALIADDASVRAGIGETDRAIVVRLMGARVWDVRARAMAIAGASSP